MRAGRESSAWVGVVSCALALSAQGCAGTRSAAARPAHMAGAVGPRSPSAAPKDASVAPGVQGPFGIHPGPGWDLNVDVIPPPPAPPPAERRGLEPGERLTYALGIDGVEGGSAEIAVDRVVGADALPAQRAAASTPAATSPPAELLVARAVGESSPFVSSVGLRLRDSVASYLLLPELRPVLTIGDDLERGKTRHVEVRRDLAANQDRAFVADFLVEEGPRPRRVRRLMPGPVYDGLGALGAVRRWPLAVGTRVSFLLLDEVWLWRIDVVVEDVRYVSVPAGGCRAFHLAGTARRADELGRPFRDRRLTRPVELWISADAARVPLEVVAGTRWGDVKGVLTSYTPPPGGRSPLLPPDAGAAGAGWQAIP